MILLLNKYDIRNKTYRNKTIKLILQLILAAWLTALR